MKWIFTSSPDGVTLSPIFFYLFAVPSVSKILNIVRGAFENKSKSEKSRKGFFYILHAGLRFSLYLNQSIDVYPYKFSTGEEINTFCLHLDLRRPQLNFSQRCGQQQKRKKRKEEKNGGKFESNI